MHQADILNDLDKEINIDIISIVRKLDGEKLLLHILMKQELMFSNLNTEKVEQKERLAESFSYLLNVIIHYKNKFRGQYTN